MKRLESRLSTPLALVAMSSVGLMIAALMAIAAQIDRGALSHERELVTRGVVGKVLEVERAVSPQVLWDDAVEHLDVRFDRAWAQENINAYLFGQAGFEKIIILDGADRPLMAGTKGRLLQPAEIAPFTARVLPLVRQVRQRDAQAPRVTGPRADRALVSRPNQTTSIETFGDEAYFLTASLVQPDFGKSTRRPGAGVVVVTALRIDQDFLTAFGDRFLLPGIHLHVGNATSEADEAHVGLRDLTGKVVATLDWTPSKPGRDLLRRSILPIGLVVGMLVLAVLISVRRSRLIAEGLIVSEARAKHMALHDALTGLPNRLLFDERLRHALDRLARSDRSLAVFIIDLDRFKEVNDTHGHNVGDELIRHASQRLGAVCHGKETVARLGGDEFGIVAPDLDAAGAEALAQRVLEALGEPAPLSCGPIFSGASMGVAVVDAFETFISGEEVARRADVALYRAKDHGRGRFCFFESEMDAVLKQRRRLEQDLRQALLRDEIHLAYQPQVNARGVLIGVEALARWNHPEQGPISPGFFIPLAEDCGLIEDLGRMVMLKAMHDSLRWPALKVAINVSATQLRRPGFTETVQDLLSEAGAHAGQIELEITEGVLLGDDETTCRALAELRGLGFSLALDDFGTGYSSLSYLRRYPIDKIKIDRSFIIPLGEDLEAAAVVGAIVRLARALRLTVIAEGVETEGQREILRSCGCGQSQGFLFSPPVSADAIDGLAKRGRHPMPLFEPPTPPPAQGDASVAWTRGVAAT